MESVIDTNALVYAAKRKVDLFSLLFKNDYEPTIPICVIAELKSLCSKAPSGAEKQAAKLAIQLIRHAKIKPTRVGTGNADQQILAYAKENQAIVITNDKPLKQRAKSLGVATISISKSGQLR